MAMDYSAASASRLQPGIERGPLTPDREGLFAIAIDNRKAAETLRNRLFNLHAALAPFDDEGASGELPKTPDTLYNHLIETQRSLEQAHARLNMIEAALGHK